jgi:hypothetical protein
MTTDVLARVPVDEITAQAREARPGRTALTLIAAVLFGLGWLVAKVFAVAWLALTWSWTAVRLGWEAQHGPSRRQRIAALEAEREELQARLSRFSG